MSGVVANKPNTESKYVSVFADSQPDVDVTFREPLLGRPSQNYMVGVDNLTVSLNDLSMLDFEDGYVLRIGHIIKPDGALSAPYNPANAAGISQAALDTQNLVSVNHSIDVTAADGAFPVDAGQMIVSTTSIPFFNVQQFMKSLRRLTDYFNQSTTLISGGLEHANGTGRYFVGYTDHANGPAEHLSFELRSDGKLEVVGSRVFWANFFISFEKPKYQRIFDGERIDSGPKFVGLQPISGKVPRCLARCP